MFMNMMACGMSTITHMASPVMSQRTIIEWWMKRPTG
jgi:hypothetical protein